MEILFAELKEKEVVNISDGKKLGRIIDILFDVVSGEIKGVVVPGERKFLRKNEDIFVPLSRLKKIGDDVILVSLGQQVTETKLYNEKGNGMGGYYFASQKQNSYNQNYDRYYDNLGQTEGKSYVRFKRLDNKKYK